MNTPELAELQRQEEIDRMAARDEILLLDFVTFEKANNYLFRWYDSYSRLQACLDLASHMDPRTWWKLLGSNWSSFDNVTEFLDELRYLWMIESTDLPAAMMRPHERRRLRSLPATLTVYRGCYEVNRDGICWSLSERVARCFPMLNRYRRMDDTPLLLVGEVNRDDAILKLDRREQEVISPYVRVVSVHTLPVGA